MREGNFAKAGMCREGSVWKHLEAKLVLSRGRRPCRSGTILVIILIIFLLGGFSGRFGGYGYGFGHSGVGLIGILLIVVLVLLVLGRI